MTKIETVDVQTKVFEFFENRPVMKYSNTPEIIVRRLILQEGEEFLAEIPVGRQPSYEEWLRMRKEIADMFIYLCQLASMYGIGVIEATIDKLAENEERFPAHMFQKGDFQTIYRQRKIELGEWQDDKVE